MHAQMNPRSAVWEGEASDIGEFDGHDSTSGRLRDGSVGEARARGEGVGDIDWATGAIVSYLAYW